MYDGDMPSTDDPLHQRSTRRPSHPASQRDNALLGYSTEEMRREVERWLEHRPAADAAVGLLDACAGAGSEAAAKRAVAQLVLADLDDSRALRVLRKAADSGVEGCRQVATVILGARVGAEAPVDPARAEEAGLWLLIDGLSILADAAETKELVRGFLEDWNTGPEALAQRVDDLWRVEHPATAHVLAELGEGLRGRCHVGWQGEMVFGLIAGGGDRPWRACRRRTRVTGIRSG